MIPLDRAMTTSVWAGTPEDEAISNGLQDEVALSRLRHGRASESLFKLFMKPYGTTKYGSRPRTRYGIVRGHQDVDLDETYHLHTGSREKQGAYSAV